MVLCEWTDAEREFIAAFSRPHGNPERGVSDEAKHQVFQVMRNDPNFHHLDVTSFGFREPDQWRLLGQYIAKNEYLKTIILSELTDRYMPHLFSELHQCPNLDTLAVRQSYFGRSGVESMVPFLRNSRNLADITIIHNARMDDECFRLIVGALDDGNIETLVVTKCDLSDISSLRNCAFPHLTYLTLSGNRICTGLSALEHLDTMEELRLDNNGIRLEQCTDLVGLLRNPNTSLKLLSLRSDKLCDESIEVLAESLKHNSTLDELDISEPSIRISERGCLALLRLLFDVSSIANTYNSNHTLVTVKLPPSRSNPKAQRMKKQFDLALDINNRYKGKPGKAGQIKAWSQLNSVGRKAMCDVQGLDFASTGSILADIDSYLLPNVLAVVGSQQDELFNVLVETAPDLIALIDKTAMMTDLLEAKRAQIDIHRAKIAALTAETESLSRRLRLLKGTDEPGAKKMRRC